MSVVWDSWHPKYSRGAHTSTYTQVSRVFCYSNDSQVGDSAHGREIRRLLHVTGLCRAHSHGIIYADGMSSDRDRYLLSERWRYDWNKEQGEQGKDFSIHFISREASNKENTEAECKDILVSCGNLFFLENDFFLCVWPGSTCLLEIQCYTATEMFIQMISLL